MYKQLPGFVFVLLWAMSTSAEAHAFLDHASPRVRKHGDVCTERSRALVYTKARAGL